MGFFKALAKALKINSLVRWKRFIDLPALSRGVDVTHCYPVKLTNPVVLFLTEQFHVVWSQCHAFPRYPGRMHEDLGCMGGGVGGWELKEQYRDHCDPKGSSNDPKWVQSKATLHIMTIIDWFLTLESTIGLWATSLTWETVPINIHIKFAQNYYTITFFRRLKVIISPIWDFKWPLITTCYI